MINHGNAAIAAAFISLTLLAGCNKASESAPKADAIAAPAAPDKPAAPDAVATASEPLTTAPATAPAASAGPDVNVSTTEARAGDVSVKLPE